MGVTQTVMIAGIVELAWSTGLNHKFTSDPWVEHGLCWHDVIVLLEGLDAALAPKLAQRIMTATDRNSLTPLGQAVGFVAKKGLANEDLHNILVRLEDPIAALTKPWHTFSPIIW